jgi:hypothetical protein
MPVKSVNASLPEATGAGVQKIRPMIYRNVFYLVPLFDKEGLGEILLDKSFSVPFFQRGRLIFTYNVI